MWECYVLLLCPRGKTHTHTHTLYIDTHWVHHTHKKSLGNSLAVQWLELCTSIAGAWVPSLARELTSCKPCDMVKKKVLIPRTISLLSPWNSPGKYTGMNRHSLLQGISLTQGLSPSLLHCRQTVNRLSHQGNPQCNSTQTLIKKKWNPSVYNVGPWSYHAKRNKLERTK